MLVIQRKVGEGFWIGEQIFVRVVRVDRGHVRLGIEAPSECRIERVDCAAVPIAATRVGAESSQNQPSAGSRFGASQQIVPESR